MSAGLIAITKGASVAGSGTLGANQIPYANSAGELQGSSALTFDGTNLSNTGTSGVVRVRAGSGSQYVDLLADNGSVPKLVYSQAWGSLVFGSDSSGTITEQMRLTSTGLGIGTSSPATRLHVAISGTGTGTGEVISETVGANGNAGYAFRTAGVTRWSVTLIGTDGSNSLRFRDENASVERMRLDSSGNLGIGVTPYGWGASARCIDLVGNVGFASLGNSDAFVLSNAYYDGSTWRYKSSSIAVSVYRAAIGAHTWFTAPSGTAGNAITFTQAMTLDASGNLRPGTDNSQTLGSGSYRWSVVYAGTGTINTSDAREKTKVSLLEDKEIEAAAALSAEIGKFQFLTSIESKGEDKARIHLGMTVQRAIEIMEKNSLDPMRYAFICYDKWEEEVDAVEGEEGAYAIISSTQKTATSQVEEKVIEVIDGVPTQKTVTKDVTSPVYEAVPVVDEDGNPVVNVTPATEEELDEEGNVVKEAIPEQVVPVTYQVPVMETVTTWKKKVSKDRYGFRYDQLIMFIAKGLEARFNAAPVQFKD